LLREFAYKKKVAHNRAPSEACKPKVFLQKKRKKLLIRAKKNAISAKVKKN